MSANALPRGYALHEYRIETLLGVGGFGLTYLATDANLNLKVALKEYLPGDIAARGADQHGRSRSSADTAETFELGQAALPRRVAHARLVPPPEHRARDALLRGERHRPTW